METKLMQVFLNVIAIFLLLAFVAIWVLGFYLVVTNPKETPIFSLLTPKLCGIAGYGWGFCSLGRLLLEIRHF